MTNQHEQTGSESFHHIHPDDVITLVEKVLDRQFSNLYRPLNSYINRVVELEDREGAGVIVKFYRPGRWKKEAIADEHCFLNDLKEQEIPVITPLLLADGTTIGRWRDVLFALFPKCGGRSVDEFNDDQLEQLGRLVGRAHAVGAIREASNRLIMTPLLSTAGQIEYLRKNKLVPAELQQSFYDLTVELLELIGPLFSNVKYQRIHGDLHVANIIHRPGESFYLIDFDDMVMGPPVQDIWMLLTDYSEESRMELEVFLEGYETFHQFDRRTFRLIEPLRAMRYIHYLAWCGHQVVEDGSTQVIPHFGSFSFWQTEIGELRDQLERIRENSIID